MTRTHRSKDAKSRQPPDLFAPCDPAEFKFCFALMNAAGSGQMAIERPKPMMIDGIGEVSFGNTPLTRGLLAMTKHLRESHARPDNADTPPEVMAVCNRVLEFGGFVMKCLKNKDARIERYVKRDPRSTDGFEVADALMDAAATAKIDESGFNGDSLFSVAGDLAAKGVESFATPQ